MNNIFTTKSNVIKTTYKQGISMRGNNITAFLTIIAFIFSAMGISVSAASEDHPRILMSGYTINDGSTDSVPAGNFTLNYTLTNYSSSGIDNLILTYSQNNAFITPVSGNANIEYIGAVSEGIEYNGSIELNIPKTANAGICKFDITLSYNSDNSSVNSQLSTSFSIYINIDNNTELVLKQVELSDEAVTTGRKRLLIDYENPGSQDFKNIKLIIDGNITEVQKIQTLPILKAGKSNSIEYYIQFTETGEQSFTVHIAYDDDIGNSYKTPLVTKSVTVSESAVIQPTPTDTPSEGYVSKIISKTKEFIQTPQFVIVLIICLSVATVVILYLPKARKRAKKKKWYYKNKDDKNGG